MLTILVKLLSVPVAILWQYSIADTTTSTAAEMYCQYQYQYFCDNTFSKVNRKIVVKKWQIHYSLQ